MFILHHVSANSQFCGSDAISFVESTIILEVTLSVCHDFGLLRFSLFKNRWVVQNFGPNLWKFSELTIFEFWQILSFFSVSKAIFFVLMAFVADLKLRQHGRSCFQSRKHHRRIQALTSLLAGSVLQMPFWLLLISQHRNCQWRSHWFVHVSTLSGSQSHPLAILVHLLSGFAHVLFTTSISGSVVEGICESIFSRSCQHVLELFRKIFSGRGSVHWMAWIVHLRSLVLAWND